MSAGIQSTLSGLQAFSLKIENNATNVANQNTERFKKESVIFLEQALQGVRATVVQVNSLGPVIVEQTGQGMEMIKQSNGDLGAAFADLILNTHGYTTNLQTLRAADEMMQTALDIKA